MKTTSLLVPLADVLKLGEKSSISERLEVRRGGPSQEGDGAAEIIVGEDVRMRIDFEREKVLHFQRVEKNLEGNVSGGKAIERSDALGRLAALLKALNKPFGADSCNITYIDLADITPGDLIGAYWSASKEFDYNGIRCVGNGFRANISVQTGEIASFSEIPVNIPTSTLRNISDGAATTIAAAHVHGIHGANLELASPPEEVFVTPRIPGTGGRELVASKSRLCWLFQFAMPDEKVAGTAAIQVFVDAESGAVVNVSH